MPAHRTDIWGRQRPGPGPWPSRTALTASWCSDLVWNQWWTSNIMRKIAFYSYPAMLLPFQRSWRLVRSFWRPISRWHYSVTKLLIWQFLETRSQRLHWIHFGLEPNVHRHELWDETLANFSALRQRTANLLLLRTATRSPFRSRRELILNLEFAQVFTYLQISMQSLYWRANYTFTHENGLQI